MSIIKDEYVKRNGMQEKSAGLYHVEKGKDGKKICKYDRPRPFGEKRIIQEQS